MELNIKLNDMEPEDEELIKRRSSAKKPDIARPPQGLHQHKVDGKIVFFDYRRNLVCLESQSDTYQLHIPKYIRVYSKGIWDI